MKTHDCSQNAHRQGWPHSGAVGLIQEREAELLRAIADTLDCPIPPFLENAKAKSMTGDAL